MFRKFWRFAAALQLHRRSNKYHFAKCPTTNRNQALLLDGYLRGVYTTISFKGIMSFYPLVDDEDQLRSLDGWLVAVIHRALKKRARLLKHWHYDRDHQFPFNVPEDQLVNRCAQVVIANKRLLTIPSFLQMFRAMKMGMTSGGIEQAMNAHSNDYLYGD